MAKKEILGAAKPPEPAPEGQKLTVSEQELIAEAYSRLDLFREGCREMHDRVRVNRRVMLLDDPGQDDPSAKTKTLQMQTLISTINNTVADQMDNMPEAKMLPETPALLGVADDLSDTVKHVFHLNDYEALHRERCEDFFIAGTAVTQVIWDPDMSRGKGDVALIRWPVEAFLWDPAAEDIQDARALIKVSWHPMSWYTEHFPEAAPYVCAENYAINDVGIPDAWASQQAGDENRAMLMEYWYRHYNAEKRSYSVSVAYIAGHALLAHEEDVYEDGQYPFVLDVFSHIEGVPAGDSLVSQLVPMMRYVNRYARYIDENLRMASKSRMLVNRNSGIDRHALSDWTIDVVEGENINVDAVKWFDTKPLSGMVVNQMLQMQQDIKQDSGQNQFTRGETAGGVTAASAISALQEAGGKISRMRTAALNRGFRRMAEMVMWRIHQFYDADRVMMVTGGDGKLKTVDMSPGHLFGRTPAGKLPPPPYTVQIQVQRRNPLQVQAQNDLFIQAYTMSAQSGQSFPLTALFELLNVDGKDKIMPILRQNDMMMAQMQQLQMQNQQMAAQIEEQTVAVANLQAELKENAKANQNSTVEAGIASQI